MTTTNDLTNLLNGVATINDDNDSNDLTGFSTQLITTSDQRVKELLNMAKTDKSVGMDIMAAIKSGTAPDLFKLLEAVYYEQIISDSKDILAGATESQLARLLESRRSERSTSKRKGFSTLKPITDYIAAGYAELVIRQASGKSYASTRGIEMDGTESAIRRRIASLRSKQSRNRKLAKLDPTVATELESIQTEIEHLQEMLGKPAAKKQLKADILSELKKLDLTALPPEVVARIQKLIEAESM